jgi:hypothetical protein
MAVGMAATEAMAIAGAGTRGQRLLLVQSALSVRLQVLPHTTIGITAIPIMNIADRAGFIAGIMVHRVITDRALTVIIDEITERAPEGRPFYLRRRGTYSVCKSFPYAVYAGAGLGE